MRNHRGAQRLIRIRAELANLIRADEDNVLLCDLGTSDQAAQDTMQFEHPFIEAFT
jgi:hypothetical protein